MMKNIIALAVFVTTLNAGAQNVLKIGTGTTLTTNGGAVITLANMNLDNDGTLNQSAGNGTFRFSGTQSSSITGINHPVIDRIEMAKTGGATLSLLRNINLVSGINFNSGLLDLNNHTILLSPGALLNNESETSRVIGAGGGYIEITCTLNAPSSFNSGNLGAIITSSQNLGSTTIRRGHQAQPIAGAGYSILRYYEILPSNNSLLNATLRFQYFDGELNFLDENVLMMWKGYGNFSWFNMGYTLRNTILNHVDKANIPDFSRLTLSSSYNARLTSQPKKDGSDRVNDNVRIQWKVWPNPVDKILWVNIMAAGESGASIQISDSKGAMIINQQYHLLPGSNPLMIDMKKLAAGVYYLLAEWDHGKTKKSLQIVKL